MKGLLFRRLVAGAALLWCVAGAASAETINVTITADAFIPDLVTVAPGDTVKWTNTDGGDHTVNSSPGVTLDSGTMAGGAVYSYTFTAGGEFPYACNIHASMIGKVRVVDPNGNDAPAKPTNTAPASGATGVPLTVTLSAGAFADPNTGDLHAASQWLLTNTATSVVQDSGRTTASKTSITIEGLANATQYSWQVRYQDDRGAWSEYSTPTTFTTIGAQQPGTGLTGTYGTYDLKKAREVKITGSRLDPTVNFVWAAGRPEPGTPTNNFFVRWEGKVLAKYSESYRFRVRADGGVRLTVNGQKLIDDYLVTPFVVYRNGVVTLEAGVPVTIKLEYFDATGNASVDLRWSSPSQVVEVIPKERLYPQPAAL